MAGGYVADEGIEQGGDRKTLTAKALALLADVKQEPGLPNEKSGGSSLASLEALCKSLVTNRHVAVLCRHHGALEAITAVWKLSPVEAAPAAAGALLCYASVHAEALRRLGCEALCCKVLSGSLRRELAPVARLWRRLGGPTVEEAFKLLEDSPDTAATTTLKPLLQSLVARKGSSAELRRLGGLTRARALLEPLLAKEELAGQAMRLLCRSAGPLEAPPCGRGRATEEEDSEDSGSDSEQEDGEEVEKATAKAKAAKRRSQNFKECLELSPEEAASLRKQGVNALLEMHSPEVASSCGECGELLVRAKPHGVSEEFYEHLSLDAEVARSWPVLYPESSDATDLRFFGDFEGGNLRRVRLEDSGAFEVLLCGDTNRRAHSQWFFFDIEVSKACEVRIHIVTFKKEKSTFAEGQLPVLRGPAENWTRAGWGVTYTPNRYSIGSKECYHTLAFSLALVPGRSRLAYFYPYLLGDLFADLRLLRPAGDWLEVLEFGCSVKGAPLLRFNITDFLLTGEDRHRRPCIVISSRVHPGESPASYVLRGVLQMLLASDEEAAELRRRFLFVVLPFLNPDGVAAGNGRSNSEGDDLNRCWEKPPAGCEVGHAKVVMEELCSSSGGVRAFVDLHAHSRRHGAFTLSNPGTEALPDLLKEFGGQLFDRSQCTFSCTGDKRSSARCVVWRELGVTHAHTLEATYAALPGKKRLVTPKELEELGRNLVRCCAMLPEEAEASSKPKKKLTRKAGGAPDFQLVM